MFTNLFLPLAQSPGWLSPALLGLMIGTPLGVLGMWIRSYIQRGQLEQLSRRIKEDAEKAAENITKAAELDSKAEYSKWQDVFQKETAETRTELKEQEKRVTKREDNLEGKLDTLSTKERNLERRVEQLDKRDAAVEVKEQEVTGLLREQQDKLLDISGMSADQAKQQLFSNLEDQLEGEMAVMVDKSVSEAKDTAASKVQDILVTAIQRYAGEHTCDTTVSTVDIPSDDMKGRVIGREGRNIRAFEKATGVDVIVDDTPGVVVVSAFDPIRREVARRSLERLIQDGRIHPGRIEEIVINTGKELEKEVLEIGKRASVDANVPGLHRKILDLLGRLRYRTSYGQNVLQHSIEVAYLCQIMADELGLDGRLARRCGLLHDIGKAVDHEVEGGHPKIGADICKRLNEGPEVLNAIAGHHGDIEATSPYTPLVMAGDAISASRPGGRRESLERYIKRLEQLEGIATEQNGVKQAYAIQAGREIRVIVDSNRASDSVAAKIARDIAKRVEEEMTYPGEIKVTVLREMRAVEYAR